MQQKCRFWWSEESAVHEENNEQIFATVSYTHLDVYKRQPLNRVKYFIKYNRTEYQKPIIYIMSERLYRFKKNNFLRASYLM